MGLWNWVKNIFKGHTDVVHPASGATVNTSTLKPIPAAAIQPTPVTLPAAPVQSSQPYPVVVAGNVECNDDEKQMIADAFVHLNKVISTPEFKTSVLAMKCTEMNGMNDNSVYSLLVSKSPIKVDFSMFDGTWQQNHVYKTMGYEDDGYPNTVFANRYFIEDVDTCASLILHETAHILGFHHYDVMATSVPYTFNDIYDAVATEIGVEK
jgi:hypothetical protein